VRYKARRLLVFLAGILAATLLLTDNASGQYTTASLSGTVVDQTGAVVPDARITVQNTDTGFTQSVTSNSSGEYLFSRLPVGNYKLTAEKPGLTTYVQSGIQLDVSQAATQKITLSVGTVSQQVTISADASLVTSQSATVSQVISQRQVVDLPLDGRQVQQLVFLAPGITDASTHYCTTNCEGGTYPGEQYAKANGTSASSINYQMDGVDYNDSYINSNLPFPNPDAIQEFSVADSNLSAEYGNSVGGVVNVVTKSGTNQIHGDGFEFLRNGDLNARNFFAPTQDTLKRNQFGGSIGGPIQKDHLFFFGTYQGTRIRQTAQGSIAFVPTAAERTGNFSDAGVQLTDPLNGNAPFANNQIPTSRLSSVSQYLLNDIPLPNGPGQQLTYPGAPQIQNDDQFMIKVDYIRGKHQLSGRYFFTNYNQPAYASKTDLLQIAGGNKVRVQNIAFTDTYSVTPHLLLNTWFGWNQQNGGSTSGAPFCLPAAGVEIAQTNPCELSIGVAGGFSIQSNHLGAFNRGSQTGREDVTFIKGGHELHFGAEALRIRAPMSNTYQENGVFGFQGALSGSSMADFILGQAQLVTQDGGIYLNFTGIKWSAFVQDNWRVTPRLTLNLGLRWDPWFPYQDSEGRVACYVPGAQSTRFPNAPVGLLFGGSNHDPGCPSASIKSSAANFAPRLGFAYRLTDDGKTSIRGGAGTYYAIPNTVAFQDVVGIPPFAPIVNLYQTVSGGNVIAPGVNFQNPYGSAGVPNPFPQFFGGLNKSVPSSAAFPQGPLTFYQIFAQNYQLPVIYLWNLTLERQLGASWLVRAAYVGNKGVHLSGTGDQEEGLYQANPVIYIPGQSNANNEQARRLNPNYGPVNEIDSNINSNYNGLQLTVEKRLTYGLSLLADYTWAKELDDFAPLSGSYGDNTVPFNRHFDYGPSDDDIRNVFKFSGLYQLPHVGAKGLAGKLINGWNLSSTVTWQGGFPFSIYSGVDNSFSGNYEDKANYIGGPVMLGSGRSHGAMVQEYFNTSAFTVNTPGTFGNTGKNILRTPRTFTTNAALIKDTKFAERASVQFRVEAFNLFNNVNFPLSTKNGLNHPGIDTTVTDGSFGQILAASDPRILQFAMKFIF
jgi:hypothetical protein